MKITYQFANGEVSEVEVSEDIGSIIVDSRRKEDNLDRKERYHCYSYDAIDYEGEEYADPDTPASLLERDELSKRVHSAMMHLSEIQIRRLTLFAEGHSIREIARMEGVDHKAVAKSIEAAKKIFAKNYKEI